jgi:hypothetical protein
MTSGPATESGIPQTGGFQDTDQMSRRYQNQDRPNKHIPERERWDEDPCDRDT